MRTVRSARAPSSAGPVVRARPHCSSIRTDGLHLPLLSKLTLAKLKSGEWAGSVLTLATMANISRDDNPYVPGFGVIPPALAGRESEFADLEAALRRVRRGIYEQPRLLTGDRGMGKTAVLAELLETSVSNGIWVVDVEASRTGDAIVPLLRELRRSLLDHDNDARIGLYAKNALAVLAAFGLKHGGTELSLEIEPAPATGGSGDLATDLGDALVAVAEVAARATTAILLSVDEIHAMPAAQMSPLFAALQRVARQHTRPGSVLPVLTAVAGLPHARAAMRAASSTYAERVREHELGLLDTAAVIEALTIPTEQLGVHFGPGALEHLLPAIGGYPYFVQLMGYEAWNAAAQSGSDEIDATAARRGATRGQAEATLVYRSRLAEVPDAERRYLQAMAVVEGDRTSSAIADVLGGDASQWAWARSRLIDRGILRPDGYGRVAFALPGLEEHLQDAGAVGT